MKSDIKLVVITGTPGVGKSTLAKQLSKKLGFYRLDLSKYYKQISAGYNRRKKCYDIDLPKFEKLVGGKIKELIEGQKKEKRQKSQKGLIIDSHIAHLLPRKWVDLCVVLTCSDLKKLEKRLEKRGYSRRKIQENLEAEIFQ